MTLNSSSGGPLDFTTFYNVIDGRFDNPKATRHTINPSSLENNPEVPLSTPTDVHAAVQAAQRAAKLWAEVPWSERKKALESFAVALESYTEDFAQMLIKEQGKPVSVIRTFNCLLLIN